MKGNIIAGVAAGHWFMAPLNWFYSVKAIPDTELEYQPLVMRITFRIVSEEMTPSEAVKKLQQYLDLLVLSYNVDIVWALWELSKNRLVIDVVVHMGQNPTNAFTNCEYATSMLGKFMGELINIDAAWVEIYQAPFIEVALEKRIPIAYISEETKFPVFVLAGLGMLGLAVLVTQPWKQRDWKK